MTSLEQPLQPASGHPQFPQEVLHVGGGSFQSLTVSRRQAAQLIGISVRTFDQIRKDGCGPSPVPGLSHRYDIDAIKRFIAGHVSKVVRRIA